MSYTKADLERAYWAGVDTGRVYAKFDAEGKEPSLPMSTPHCKKYLEITLREIDADKRKKEKS